ncbi:unnamed protein product, partial [Rotaria sp. Silwood2]
KEINESLPANQPLIKVYRDMSYMYQFLAEGSEAKKKYDDLAIEWCLVSLEKATNKKDRIETYEFLVQMYRIEKTSHVYKLSERDHQENRLIGIRYKELQVEEALEYYSPLDLNVAIYYYYLAVNQRAASLKKEAMANFEKAIEIHLAQEKPRFDEIAYLYWEIGQIHEDQKDYTSAIDCKKKEIQYRMEDEKLRLPFRDFNRESFHRIKENHKELASLYIKLHKIQLACDCLSKAIQRYENSEYEDKNMKIRQITERIKKLQCSSVEEAQSMGLQELPADEIIDEESDEPIYEELPVLILEEDSDNENSVSEGTISEIDYDTEILWL